jgi:oxaloacetate decarboxylase alpha subunit
MVTPYSQFFGVQAAVNVMVGERYKEVTDEVLQYALGEWGDEEAKSIDPNLRDKLLNLPRAKELSNLKTPDMTRKQFREKFGGAGVSDDEAILRYFAGEAYVVAMKAAGPAREYASKKSDLATLIEQATKHTNFRQIYVRRGSLTLRLEKRQKCRGHNFTKR